MADKIYWKIFVRYLAGRDPRKMKVTRFSNDEYQAQKSNTFFLNQVIYNRNKCFVYENSPCLRIFALLSFTKRKYRIEIFRRFLKKNERLKPKLGNFSEHRIIYWPSGRAV